MNPNPRQAELLDEVRRLGSVSMDALAARFGVTLQTLRRDVKLLSEAGLLARFHGGARVPGSTTENIAYRQRQLMNQDAKRAIARELVKRKGLRVITNNLNVAAILSDNPDCEVIVAGGVVRTRDRGIVGEATVDFMRQFRVDIGIIGISGIEDDGTLRDFDFREVKVTHAIMGGAREVWLAADHAKFNRPAMVEVGRITQIDMLFTDREPPAPFGALLAEAGVQCTVAERN